MTTLPYSPTEVAALRKEMSLYGTQLSPTAAWELLRKVGNRHICVDALLMVPRPAWLTSMVGPAVEKVEKA